MGNPLWRQLTGEAKRRRCINHSKATWKNIQPKTVSIREQSLPDYGAYVSRQVAPAGGASEILLRVQSIRVDHEVAICQVATKQTLCISSGLSNAKQGLGINNGLSRLWECRR